MSLIQRRYTRVALLLGLLSLSMYGCDSDDGPSPDDPPTDDLKPGQSQFFSADGYAGQESTSNNLQATAAAGPTTPAAQAVSADSATEGGAERSANAEVVEGDIYKVLDTGTILNLNAYRGLQVIDVSDPDAPAIIGNYPVQGDPVEMYVHGDRVFVLLNNWSGYYGSRDDVAVEHLEGGLLLSIDLSDRTAPSLTKSRFIRGYIQKSRLVVDGDTAALYLASSAGEEKIENGYYEWVETTVVTSFDAAGGKLTKMSELDLGGYVQDIQATPHALLVATRDWNRNGDYNEVSIVDISDASGKMVKGDAVPVFGYIQNQFNMDLTGDVLRVVSTNWDRNTSNMVETFDASDIANVTKIDSCAFGEGQDLYATLFLEDRAFFVTYLRRDPFHAFSIDAEGHCAEQNEFIVSGWNDFFRPVAGGKRLIGIGQDDAGGGRSPAVSLYDITDLTNNNPLLQRGVGKDLDWGWSEANYDHRAFSVLEGAVDVRSPGGEKETGLVLLPFSGYHEPTGKEEYGYEINGVQIFTFSDSTVTARAAMEHSSNVRRAFLVSDHATANLSEQSLSLFDHSDPDMPKELGTVELAPDFGRVLRFGDYLARFHRPEQYYYYDIEGDGPGSMGTMEIVRADADPNTTDVVASFEVPLDARLLKAGDLLVATSFRYRECFNWPCPYDTTVHLYDLSDPKHPEVAGTAAASDLSPSYVGFGGDYYYGGGAFIGCGVGPYWFSGNQVDGIFAIGDSIVYASSDPQEEVVGTMHSCSTWVDNNCSYSVDEAGREVRSCSNAFEGYESCEHLDDAPDQCWGEFYRCDYSTENYDCEVVPKSAVDGLRTQCDSYPYSRYWSSYKFKALDVSDPSKPKFGPMMKMSAREEAVRLLPDGDFLYYTYKQPAEPDDDKRPRVQYFFKRLSFDNAEAPGATNPINIPGELIAVDGDQLYTRDLRWGDETAESYLHELVREGEVAKLSASRRFEGRQVLSVVTDDQHLLVSHRPLEADGGYGYGPYRGGTPIGDVAYAESVSSDGAAPEAGPKSDQDQLSIFSHAGLELLGEINTDRWSSLEGAHSGKVLYTVPGGMMLFNIEDVKAPYAQAYFPTYGWPEQIMFDAEHITIAAGRYGIHRFGTEEFNLLSE